MTPSINRSRDKRMAVSQEKSRKTRTITTQRYARNFSAALGCLIGNRLRHRGRKHRGHALNAHPKDENPGLADLARGLIGLEDDGQGDPPRPVALPATGIEIALEDLIADDNGEVVLFNDSGFRTLSIRAKALIVDNGQVRNHVTLSGEDVSGFKYVAFDNGLTLYFEEGLDWLLQQG